MNSKYKISALKGFVLKSNIYWVFYFSCENENIPSNNQNKLGNSKGKIQTSFKTSFYKWIFRQQKFFLTISEAYQFDPKHHRNIIEIRFEHLGSLHPFWWHFFETRTLDFFGTLYLTMVILAKKRYFFMKIFLNPQIF